MGDKAAAVRTYSFLLITLGVYYLLWQFLSARISLPVYYYARLIEALAILLFVALALFTPMRFSQMGILVPVRVLWRSLSAGLLIALGFTALLLPLSALMGNRPLFAWHLQGDISRATYFLVAPLQELLAKSVMYYSFELCFDGKHPHLTNAMSALVFALFHVVYGLRMMLLSMLLCLLTGWLFRKYRCVWGCALVHFALGFLPPCFGF